MANSQPQPVKYEQDHWGPAFAVEFGERNVTGPNSLGDISSRLNVAYNSSSEAAAQPKPSMVEAIPGVKVKVEHLDIGTFGEAPYESRQRRIDRLTLPNGRSYTAILTKAHPAAKSKTKDNNIGFLVPGYTEIPTAEDSSGRNFHDERALRYADEDTVSIDWHGLSPDDSQMLPWEGVQAGLLSIEEQADDFLLLAAYYAKGAGVKLVGTSAGVGAAVHMADRNENVLGKNKMNIKSITGFAPKLVANGVPPEEDFRNGENEKVTRALTVGSFAVHTAINASAIGFNDPKIIWDNKGIILALRPHMAFVLPAQFFRHTAGINYSIIKRVSTKCPTTLVEAEKDVLNNERQIDKLNAGNPNPIRVITVKGEGHVSLPLKPKKAFDALEGVSHKPELSLVGSGIQKAVRGANSAQRLFSSPLRKLAA